MKKLDLTNCELHEILALNLVSVRLNAELEQSDIAEMFNVSVQTISSYECGTSIPSPAFVYRYASYFSIPVERLFRAEPQAGEAAGSDVPLIPDREEARMLACYRATPAWMQDVIRELCFNGPSLPQKQVVHPSYAGEESHINEHPDQAADEKKKK